MIWTSSVPLPRRGVPCLSAVVLLGLALASSSGPVFAADVDYPFEGTWIRADRMCSIKATLVRTYTEREVLSSRSRCQIRRVVGNAASGFDLVEECRHNDRRMTVTESIRMLTPDMMTLRRHEFRLKIPRAIRFARCTIAAPVPGPNRPH